MAATPMGRHEAEREFQALVDAIATLPPRCQAVFVMHKIHEVPQAQVADRLGISVKTVESTCASDWRPAGTARPRRGTAMTQPSKRNGQVPLDDALERHRDALKDLFPLPPSRPKSRKASKAAGVALLLALAIGALAWLDPAYKRERFATAIGERRDVTLADGSQLLLDSGSQIEVSWHPLSRRVALRAGQVFSRYPRRAIGASWCPRVRPTSACSAPGSTCAAWTTMSA